MNSALRVVAFAALSVLLVRSHATAQQSFNDVIVFGDSLSDTGNVYAITGGAAVYPPHFGGRFSNGPVWVERLAERLGLGVSTETEPVPAPSLTGGTNYAFGGAQAGSRFSPTACATIDGARTCVPNIGTQIDMFFADGRTLDGGELIVVQGGSNNQAALPAAIQIAQHVSTLAAAGGEHFLIPNMHPVYHDPSVVYDAQRWHIFVEQFNTALDVALDSVEAQHAGITVARFDFKGVVDGMVGQPEQYGLVNVTDPACPLCTPFPPPEAAATIVDNPDEYLYWDGFHFTATANRIIGDAAADQVNAMLDANLAATAVPEPASLASILIAVGLSGFRVAHRCGRPNPIPSH